MKYNILLKNKELKKIFNLIDDNASIPFYHGLPHVLNVIDNLNKLGSLLKIDLETLEYLRIAAILHDTGQLYGPTNHYLKSKEYASNYLKDKMDSTWFEKILSAIEKHHEKEKVAELSLFDHLLLFADKMDFTYTRLNKKYLEKHPDEYLIANDILSIDFTIENNIFFVIIKTNNLDINKLKDWSYYSKIIKRIEEFANKLQMNYKIKII